MTGYFKIRIPETAVAAAGPILLVPAPAASARLVGFRICQRNKTASELLNFAWGPLTTNPTGGSDIAPQALPGVTANPFNGTKVLPFTTSGAMDLADEYFGWNLVSGEYSFTPPPKLELPLVPGNAYAFWLLNDPSAGGVALKGTFTFAVDF